MRFALPVIGEDDETPLEEVLEEQSFEPVIGSVMGASLTPTGGEELDTAPLVKTEATNAGRVSTEIEKPDIRRDVGTDLDSDSERTSTAASFVHAVGALARFVGKVMLAEEHGELEGVKLVILPSVEMPLDIVPCPSTLSLPVLICPFPFPYL